MARILLALLPFLTVAGTSAAQRAIPGMVRDHLDLPVSGATVRIYDLLQAPQLRPPYSRDMAPLREVATDARGRFTLRALPPAGAWIEIEKPGYFVHSVPFTGSLPAIVAKLVPGGTIAGRVVDDAGKPCRAELTVYYEGSVAQHLHQTDAAGSFKINREHRGRYMIMARNRDRRLTGTSDLFDANKTDIEVRFIKSRVATKEFPVRAVDADGKPITQFRAVALWGPSAARITNNLGGIRNYLTNIGRASNAEGLSYVHGPGTRAADSGAIAVYSKGYLIATGPCAATDWPENNDGKTPPKVVRLRRAGSLVGKLVDDRSGEPLRDVTIEAQGEAATIVRSPNAPPLPKTGADGTFALTDLDEEDLRITFRRNGLVIRVLEVRGKPGKTIKAGELRARLFTVRGKLGNHSKGTRVAMVERQNNARGLLTATTSARLMQPSANLGVPVDAAGGFVLTGIPRGRHVLEVRIPQPAGDAVTIALPARRIKGDADLGTITLREQAGQLAGRVVFEHTAVPRNRVLVMAEPAAANPRFRTTRPAVGPRSLLGKKGEFELLGPPGDYELKVLDLATGVVLHRSEAVTLAAGSAEKLTLRLRLGLVRVALRADPELPVLSHLAVAATSEDANVARPLSLTYGAMSGLPLTPGATDVELILPTEEHILRAFNGRLWMGKRVGRAGLRAKGEVEVQPKLQAPVRVVLKVDGE